MLAVYLNNLLDEAAIAAEKNSNQGITPIIAHFRAPSNIGRYTMNPVETNRFNELYQRHLRLLKLQGKSQKTN